MFAWIHTINHPTGQPAVDGVFDGYLFEEVGRSRTTLVSLWPTRDDAAAAAARAVPTGTVVRDEIYEVEVDLPGPAAVSAPRAAALLDFDGPQGPARVAAARRAFHERIAPALADQPDWVRVLLLWQPEACAHVVVNVTASLEALAAIERAVNSTPLLPGEDPALLPGPDRVAIHQITSHIQGVLR